MIPEGQIRKREQPKSPLNELDDELLPRPNENASFSTSAIAIWCVVRFG